MASKNIKSILANIASLNFEQHKDFSSGYAALLEEKRADAKKQARAWSNIGTSRPKACKGAYGPRNECRTASYREKLLIALMKAGKKGIAIQRAYQLCNGEKALVSSLLYRLKKQGTVKNNLNGVWILV